VPADIQAIQKVRQTEMFLYFFELQFSALIKKV